MTFTLATSSRICRKINHPRPEVPAGPAQHTCATASHSVTHTGKAVQGANMLRYAGGSLLLLASSQGKLPIVTHEDSCLKEYYHNKELLSTPFIVVTLALPQGCRCRRGTTGLQCLPGACCVHAAGFVTNTKCITICVASRTPDTRICLPGKHH